MLAEKLAAIARLRTRIDALKTRGVPPRSPVLESVAQQDLGRSLGALLGLAVGDALGTTLEFTKITGAAFPELMTGPHREIIGAGPFDLKPGQVTDDTQMALCLFHSLVAHHRLDVDDVVARYRQWQRVAFDIGMQTQSALGLVPEVAPLDAGRVIWQRSGRQSSGNGALMRTAPIGVLLSAHSSIRRDATFFDGAITHFDPRSQLACAAFNAAISIAIATDRPPSPTDLVDAARGELEPASATLVRRYNDITDLIASAAHELADDLAAAERPDPTLYGPELDLRSHQGFVRSAFRLAFWELVHAPSFEAGLIDVANRGGDSDSNGAIAGALLGAFHGIDAIPDRWLTAVLSAQSAEPLLARELHPSRFVDELTELFARAAALR
ncbi:MAG: ADP-ribosylglycohydrolase family protein [Kofleriaceae bacterium]